MLNVVVLTVIRHYEQQFTDGADADMLLLQPPFEYEAARLHVSHILAGISANNGFFPSVSPATNVSCHGDHRVVLAMQVILAEFRNPDLNIHVLAHELNMSHWHLSRLLKQSTGSGFRRHVTTVRLREVRRLLEETLLTIKEVAAATGFRRGSDLDVHFNRAYDVTPVRWRQMKSAIVRHYSA